MDWLDKAIRKAGGYRAVSEASGVSEFHLRNAGAGRRRIGWKAVNKLKAVLPSVPQKRWYEALSQEPTPRPDPTNPDVAA